MIKFENTEVFNFKGALRGMRNPMNSWSKSDSEWVYENIRDNGHYMIGPNDLDLAKRLIKGGSEHRKFLRQIFVSVDITAPLYWWKEADTYKVGTVANSCSTMHKIHAKEFALEDFSCEHLIDSFGEIWDIAAGDECRSTPLDILYTVINALNIYREKYIETKDKKYWWQIIQLLPSSYNQKRTVTMNCENVYSIYKQRVGHKLDEWHEFRKWAELLPYFKEFFLEE